MRGRFLATLVLAAAITGLAQANYVVIIANLNEVNESESQTGGGLGGPGGMSGPGGLGGLGGLGGPGGRGGPGRGSSGYGAGGRGGMGFTPGGMGGPGGLAGGPGGGYPGAGMMGGGMGGYGMAPEDADDDSYIVVAVIDVGELTSNKLKNFESELYDKLGTGMPLTLSRLGGKINLKRKTPMYEVIPLKTNGLLLYSPLTRFNIKKNRLGADSTSGEKIDLARSALENDLLAEFTRTMDEVAEKDKDNPIVKTYLQIKAAIEQPVSNQEAASLWKERLLEHYRLHETPHYAVLHNHSPDTMHELRTIADRLEYTFRAYFYWWALRGIALPVPTERQVVILAEKPAEFSRLSKHLTSSPVFTDSFYSRREGIAVLSAKRQDDSYVTLERIAKPLWEKGYVREELLRGAPKAGIPRSMWPQLLTGRPIDEVENARFYALLLRAMEDEWEATSISHQASRQLIYASNLLPRNVHVPEWLMFGLGSFFEVPMQSPFGGSGAPSPYWLPRFRESYKAKQYNLDKDAESPSAYEALVQVVTDAGFRSQPEITAPLLGETPEMTANRIKEAHLRRARSAAWSLTFFLARQELDGLQNYFKELSKMPRDVELDEQVLLNCFARSFGCVNLDKSVNKARLTALADRWIRYINSTQLEADGVHQKIREYYKQVTQVRPQSSGGNQPGGGIGGPGRGGLPGTGIPGTGGR